jgi:hypothetical protein
MEKAILVWNAFFVMIICQPNFTIDVAPCFVLLANRSLVGILHNVKCQVSLVHGNRTTLVWLHVSPFKISWEYRVLCLK